MVEETTKTAVATAAAVTTVATKSHGLRLETDQNDGHCRQSQHHLKHIALHQKYLRTHGQKVEQSTVL